MIGTRKTKMYLIKDSRCSLRASFHFSASFPAPASLPSCPNAADTESKRTGSGDERWGQDPSGPEGRPSPKDGELRSQGLAVFRAPPGANLHGSRIQLRTFTHSKLHACTLEVVENSPLQLRFCLLKGIQTHAQSQILGF